MFGSKKAQGNLPAENIEKKDSAGIDICRVPAIAYYGRRRHIDTKKANNGAQIRAFWEECREDGTLDRLRALALTDAQRFTAACTNFETRAYDYWIVVEPDPGAEPPEDFERLEVGERQCAVFPCEGPAHEAVSKQWHYIYNTWFPRAKYGYDAAQGVEIENYPFGDMDSPDYRCEILVPVKPAQTPEMPRRRDTTLVVLFVAVGAVAGILLARSSDNALLFAAVGGAAAYFIYAYISKRREEIKKKSDEEKGEDY